MKDFLKNELKIDDEVIYIKLMRTGSSSSRNVMFKGKIVGFTPKMVKIERQYTQEYFGIGGIDTVTPYNICKLNS